MVLSILQRQIKVKESGKPTWNKKTSKVAWVKWLEISKQIKLHELKLTKKAVTKSDK